jgi:hypothetical protein
MKFSPLFLSAGVTRFGLSVWDWPMGIGAWWFRYLLMNPGRGGCAGNPRGMPVQVWATWFPREGKPQSFIQKFSAHRSRSQLAEDKIRSIFDIA